MATILITGGTGVVGRALTTLLSSKGYKVIILSRHPKSSPDPNVSYALWDPQQQTIDLSAIAEADHIVNLAGEGIADKRWTKKRKQEIVESRVKSGELLVNTLRDHPNKVKSLISASGIGWYGDDSIRPASKKMFTEEDPADENYLGVTCKAWEASVDPARQLGKRIVKLRTGLALTREGGALKEFEKPVRFGFATIFGSGSQVMSWIHIQDLVRIYLYAIENDTINGVYNAVAPQPVTNKNFITTLGESMKGKFCIPFYVPSFMLKLVLGELSVELLKGATVSSLKIGNAGFQFQFPTLQAALENLEKNSDKQ